MVVVPPETFARVMRYFCLVFFSVLVFAQTATAFTFETFGVYRRVRPTLVDRYSGFDSTNSGWSSIDQSQTMVRNYDLEGYLTFTMLPLGIGSLNWGIYGVYTLP